MIFSRAVLCFVSVIAVFIFIPEVQCESILFYFGSSIYSHRVAVWPLVLELAQKGHKVTFLSSFKSTELGPNAKTHENIIEFRPKSLKLYLKEKEDGNKTRDMITSRVKGFGDGQAYWEGALQNALEVCRVIFRSVEVQQWVDDSKFDLVVIDTPYNECALGLAFKLNVPHILYGTTSLYMWHQEMFGLPDETSWLPNYYYHFPTDMTFFQRMKNALVPLQWSYSTNRVSYIMPQLESLMRKALNLTEMPKLDELEKGTSLFLLNTHFTQEYPRSLPPFVVPVGGMHCDEKVVDEPLEKVTNRQSINIIMLIL
jgi:glucuronosyltransferase